MARPSDFSKQVVLSARQGKPSGTNVRMVCPACGKPKMYYNPENGGYNCFSASCGVRGFTKPGVSSFVDRPKETLYDKVNKLSMTSARPHDAPKDYLKYITYPVWYVPDYDRVAYEVHTFAGEHLGWVLRSYHGVTPKALTALLRSSLHVPKKSRRHCGAVVLVEDIVSAEKLSHVTPAVALLGTQVRDEYISQLLQAGVTSVTIALDEDATAKAIEVQSKLGVFNTQVQFLEKDCKDSTLEELKEIFGEKT